MRIITVLGLLLTSSLFVSIRPVDGATSNERPWKDQRSRQEQFDTFPSISPAPTPSPSTGNTSSLASIGPTVSVAPSALISKDPTFQPTPKQPTFAPTVSMLPSAFFSSDPTSLRPTFHTPTTIQPTAALSNAPTPAPISSKAATPVFTSPTTLAPTNHIRTSSSSSGNSSGTIGAVVGGLVGGMLLMAVGCWLWNNHRTKRNDDDTLKVRAIIAPNGDDPLHSFQDVPSVSAAPVTYDAVVPLTEDDGGGGVSFKDQCRTVDQRVSPTSTRIPFAVAVAVEPPSSMK